MTQAEAGPPLTVPPFSFGPIGPLFGSKIPSGLTDWIHEFHENVPRKSHRSDSALTSWRPTPWYVWL